MYLYTEFRFELKLAVGVGAGELANFTGLVIRGGDDGVLFANMYRLRYTFTS